LNLHAFNRVLRTTLLMPIILLGILAGVLVWQIQEALAAQGRVARAGEVIQRLYKLQALIVDEETGLRGYQLTGNRQMLEPYQAGDENAEKQFQALANLLNTPEQKLRLAQVRDQYALWQGYAYPALSAGKQSASADQVAADLQSKAVMDQLRSRMSETIRMEQQARDELLRAAQRRIHDFLRIVLAAGFAVGVLIGTFTSSRLRRVSRAYEESLQQLKTRNEELYESRQSYLTTLESIGEGVIACDTIGRVRFMNAVAQKLTGWTMEEALEQPLTEVFNAVDEKTRLPIQKLTAPASSLVDGTAAPEEPILLLARDARELVIAKSAAPIRDVTGNALGIVVVFRDITATRNAEQALLSSEKLAITGRLAASIAHEIHNPLDSVANLHFLLRSEQDPTKRDQYLGMAEQELSRTLQISRAMLSLYRESRSPVDVVLPELIDSVLLLLDRKIKQAQIRVERHYQSAGHVRAFPGELRQVFTNVFANAAEASQEGGVIRVTIMSSSLEDGEPGTVVEVSDTGSGVDPLVEKKLFQPFVTTKGEKGTGLGLWVSLGIVQKHGGTMRITNNTAPFASTSRRKDDQRRVDPAPRGACVRIYLPAQYDGGPPTHIADEDTVLPTTAETARAEEAAGAFHFPS
jgi:PAS domain S-box-containing protein